MPAGRKVAAMSRNFRIFVFAAIVFWVVGAMNDAVVMYVLAGVGLAIILTSYLLAHLAMMRLRIELSLPPGPAYAGAPLRPRLTVRSVGSITVGSAEVELRARNLTVEGADARRRVLLPPLPPGAEVEAVLELTPPTRGRYELGPPVLIDSDPIGMFEAQRSFGAPLEVVAFPRTYELPRVAAWDTGYGRQFARARQVRRDQGEFRGIREHTPGDDLRHVHWKVTAHVGELAVKEYEPLRHDVISIHLDLAATNHYGEGELSTLETAISAAASIARAGLAEQRSVAVHGEGLPAELGRPGGGQAQMQRIMVALAEVRAAGAPGFTATLARQLRTVPRGATIFVITTAAEDDLARVLSAGSGSAAGVTLLIVEGERAEAEERFLVLPRRVAEMALGAGIAVATLRTPADIAEALTGAASPGAATVGVR